MRRRARETVAEPPARLRAFRPIDWTAAVDPADPDADTAYRCWTRARLAWHAENGWPGGAGIVDLLLEHRAVRRSLPPEQSPVHPYTPTNKETPA